MFTFMRANVKKNVNHQLSLFFNNLCLVKVGGDIKSDCRDWRRLEHS